MWIPPKSRGQSLKSRIGVRAVFPPRSRSPRAYTKLHPSRVQKNPGNSRDHAWAFESAHSFVAVLFVSLKNDTTIGHCKQIADYLAKPGQCMYYSKKQKYQHVCSHGYFVASQSPCLDGLVSAKESVRHHNHHQNNFQCVNRLASREEHPDGCLIFCSSEYPGGFSY